MDTTDKKAKIRILRNGPYRVTGSVPLDERIIRPEGKHYRYEPGRNWPLVGTYLLCRCGHTSTPPFCDGAHLAAGFDGTECASREPFVSRARVFRGQALDLLDDGRCAFARFCHREAGTAWSLLPETEDPDLRSEAVTAAVECPAGRLVPRDHEGNLLEPELSPAIHLLQDPEKGVSGGLAVEGDILLESCDGTLYEPSNRRVLCRCGKSSNLPFCDASHGPDGFRDDGLPE